MDSTSTSQASNSHASKSHDGLKRIDHGVSPFSAMPVMANLAALTSERTPLVATDSATAAMPTNSAANATAVKPDADVRWFNGRPIRPLRTMRMLVTAYSPDAQS